MAIIKSCPVDGTLLYIDGKFVASWRHISTSPDDLMVIANMIEAAVTYGEQKKAAEIREVLGAK